MTSLIGTNFYISYFSHCYDQISKKKQFKKGNIHSDSVSQLKRIQEGVVMRALNYSSEGSNPAASPETKRRPGLKQVWALDFMTHLPVTHSLAKACSLKLLAGLKMTTKWPHT